MRSDLVPGEARGAERALAIGYAPETIRPGLVALLALDDALGSLVRGTRTPVAGQLRLAWWRDALVALDHGQVPAEPILRALATNVTPRLGGARLVALVDGWEALMDEPVDLASHAAMRGAGLFTAAATLAGIAPEALTSAGRGWALADIATHWSEQGVATRARVEALAALDKGPATPWPRALRTLGALTLLARADLRGDPPGSPRRVGRLVWHRLTGR